MWFPGGSSYGHARGIPRFKAWRSGTGKSGEYRLSKPSGHIPGKEKRRSRTHCPPRPQAGAGDQDADRDHPKRPGYPFLVQGPAGIQPIQYPM